MDKMLFEVVLIDGDYANLKRIDVQRLLQEHCCQNQSMRAVSLSMKCLNIHW